MSNDKQENFTSILHELPGMIRHSGELEHLIDFANMLILENEALKKQIKRLESDCEYLSYHFGLETDQNQRYREEIVRAIEHLKEYGMSVRDEMYIEELEEVLEGEE